MRYLLDTDVLSEIRKPNPDGRVVAWLRERPVLDFAISVLSAGEIQRGVSLLTLAGNAPPSIAGSRRICLSSSAAEFCSST